MKFSIITVVKNRVDEIEQTIESVLSQDYNNLEYIIFDGNSTDGTSEKINKFDKNILYFREKDFGVYDGLNKGYEQATGEIIGHLHAGDIFSDNNCIKNINQKFLKNNIDWLSGNLQFVNFRKKTITREWNYNINEMNIRNVFKVAHTSVFFKKKILKKLDNYNLEYKIASDTDFLLRLSRLNLKYFYLDDNILQMSHKGLSTSWKNSKTKILEDIKIYNKHFGLFGFFFYLKKIFFKISKILNI